MRLSSLFSEGGFQGRYSGHNVCVTGVFVSFGCFFARDVAGFFLTARGIR
jgi:hypothetical protein